MNNFNAKNVINGTFGEVWVDGNYMAQATAFEATVEFTYEDIKMVKNLGTAKKYMGHSGSGSIKLNHVTSAFVNKLSESMKKGNMVTSTIIGKLEDPDGLGSERVQINNVVFDSMKLMAFENKALTEEDISFTFDGWEILDSIAD